MILNCKYVSLWDDEIELKTPATFDTDTSEVETEAIELGGVMNLTAEYLEFQGDVRLNRVDEETQEENFTLV